MTVTLLALLAGVWGVVMATAPALQIRRMIVRRSSADVSLGYYGVLLPGFGLWVSYGMARGDLALVIPNAVALVVAIITILIALLIRRPAVQRSTST